MTEPLLTNGAPPPPPLETASLLGPRAEARRHRLHADQPLAPVLRAMSHDRHPVALSGAWFGGGAVVASEPLWVSEGPDVDLDPFDLLDRPIVERDVPARGAFGGWIGNLGYRCGGLVERLPDGPPRPVPAPDWWLGFYDHLLRWVPGSGWWFEELWTPERDEALARRRAEVTERLAAPAPRPGTFSCGPFVATPSDARHRAAVEATIEHIRAGDVYQANVCLRLDARLSGSPLELWCAGVDALEPPYAAYVDQGGGRAVASLSPEQFLRREGATVRTRPIKGTRPRTGDADSDAVWRAELEGSAKERAENVMIVDLMRNDLGRVCVPWSIGVPRLFEVEAHPGVWHLVSEVEGTLRPSFGDGGLLRATFPPGSVTGAPKVRAMEVIAEVEATGREAYTGAIGMVSAGLGAEWNVAIRTFEVDGERIWLGAGGGIVADSDPAAELEECATKGRPLVAAVGSHLAADDEGR